MGFRFGAIVFSAFLFTSLISLTISQLTAEDEAAKVFLDELDAKYVVEANKQMKARWAYITDVTDQNSANQVQANIAYQTFQRQAWLNITAFDSSAVTDPTIKREFEFLNILGPAALQDQDLELYNQLAADMETIYSTAKICDFNDPNNCNLLLDPHLTEIMATSDNYDELLHVWVQWREKAGKPIRSKYLDFVEMNNKAAVANGYGDMGQLWNKYYLYDGYSEEQFKNEIETIWVQLKPLYEQLYTYVRRILAENVYPGKVQRYGRLPAHVLGNMWAQTWGNIARHVLPYNADPIDATPEMIAQGYDAQRMFELSEKFFRDLGFDNMTATFWSESMIERPSNGREVVCHASAEEFYIGPTPDRREDFRIKMCTAVNQEDLVTVHHEMGHIQYFMRYRNQHWVFRNGANPGFHEAIGDTMALAVSTPAHLEKIGLLKPSKSTKAEPRFKDLPALPDNVSERDINYLLTQALEKVAFIPFGYLMDKWRWSVFSGEVRANMNEHWWKLRQELQGLQPPAARSEEDFDPGAKYHIPANVEYIRYFVSYIIQFQFYEAMCKAAGQYDPQDPNLPLYKCDFDGNTEAGKLLMDMMDPGFSRPWPDALESITGSRNMNAESLVNYFKPLKDWLEEANLMANDCIGWEACEAHAKQYMENEYEPETRRLWNALVQADWNYQTDLTEENSQASTAATIAAAAYRKQAWTDHVTQYEWEQFQDEELKRKFLLLENLGTAALPEEQLTELSTVINKMANQYSSSKICPYKKPNCTASELLSLEPGIESVLTSSRDYDELSYVWSEWRRVASKPMKPDYQRYVELSNLAAEANGLNDMSELWVAPYETDNFLQELESLLNQTRPLYEEIHAYARMKLRQRYGEERIDSDTPIPAMLFGNMWAQDWGALLDILTPYPDAGIIDVTDEMISQGYTVLRMFQISEGFFTSLGLEPMPTSYGENSMIEKPTDREVVCHASAWDFYDGQDFRIKMCTNIDMADLITVHHELGHIQYYVQYADQSIIFRDGANPGFHEAIGDVLSLSVSSPGHLSAIGLLPNFTPSNEADLNFLMKLALEKVTFLPFAYVMDRWRHGVFKGEYSPSNWTYSWHMLLERYQGIIPPVFRAKDDFDPGAKYHIAADVEYSRYFVAHILQFQLHKKLCIEAGQFVEGDPDKPLVRCDIYRSTAAGDIMRKLLQAGSSRPWRDVLMEAIGTDSLDASAILDYFAPLRTYLQKQLSDAGEPKGWRSRFEEFVEVDTEPPPPVDNTVPIIVGVVLAVLVVAVVIAYFVGRQINKKKEKRRRLRGGSSSSSSSSDAEQGNSVPAVIPDLTTAKSDVPKAVTPKVEKTPVAPKVDTPKPDRKKSVTPEPEKRLPDTPKSDRSSEPDTPKLEKHSEIPESDRKKSATPEPEKRLPDTPKSDQRKAEVEPVHKSESRKSSNASHHSAAKAESSSESDKDSKHDSD